MKRYIFNIVQDFGGHKDDQNVWTLAENETEARNNIQSEYHSIVKITLRRVTNHED